MVTNAWLVQAELHTPLKAAVRAPAAQPDGRKRESKDGHILRHLIGILRLLRPWPALALAVLSVLESVVMARGETSLHA